MMQKIAKNITRLNVSRLFPLTALFVAFGVGYLLIAEQTPSEKYEQAKQRCAENIWAVVRNPNSSSSGIRKLDKPYPANVESLSGSSENYWHFVCAEQEAEERREGMDKMDGSLSFLLLPLVAVAVGGAGIIWWLCEEVNHRQRRS